MSHTCRIMRVAMVFLAGCASSAPPAPEPVREVPRATPAGVLREEFDPQTLDDDDFLIVPGSDPAVPEAAPPGPAAPGSQAAGYRVQVAALGDRARVEQIRQRVLGQLGLPVHVVHDAKAGLYKLHVGDARTAAEAETLRQAIRAKGFPEAFIVRSPVDVSPARRQATASGWRVQIFSASSRDAAERAAATARAAFGRDDVYIEFEPPLFRVRVGDFRIREEADRFLPVAKAHGYDTPYSVKTQVVPDTR